MANLFVAEMFDDQSIVQSQPNQISHAAKGAQDRELTSALARKEKKGKE